MSSSTATENVNEQPVVDSATEQQPATQVKNGEAVKPATEEVTNGKEEETRDSTQSASGDEEDEENGQEEGEDEEEATEVKPLEKNGNHAENGTEVNGNAKSRKRVSEVVGEEEAAGEDESTQKKKRTEEQETEKADAEAVATAVSAE